MWSCGIIQFNVEVRFHLVDLAHSINYFYFPHFEIWCGQNCDGPKKRGWYSLYICRKSLVFFWVQFKIHCSCCVTYVCAGTSFQMNYMRIVQFVLPLKTNVSWCLAVYSTLACPVQRLDCASVWISVAEWLCNERKYNN